MEDPKKWHPFFLPFVELLEEVQVGNGYVSFHNSDVCFVDAIKCPSQTAWGNFVREIDGKAVWDNCLRIKNKFLTNQLEMHKPNVVLCYGTGQLIKVAQKGKKVSEYTGFSNGMTIQVRILSQETTKRTTIEFSKANLKVTKPELKHIRKIITENTYRNRD
jgi:hypothetical protein